MLAWHHIQKVLDVLIERWYFDCNKHPKNLKSRHSFLTTLGTSQKVAEWNNLNIWDETSLMQVFLHNNLNQSKFVSAWTAQCTSGTSIFDTE